MNNPVPDDPASQPNPQFALEYDALGQLVLIDAAGRRHVGVAPVRMFPISDPDGPVSIVDAAGRELASISRLDGLPDWQREMIQSALAEREFMPVIRRIISVSSDLEPSQWEAQTDRGRVTFQLDDEEDVRRLGPYRVVIIDAHKVRFLVDDVRKLDAASRRILENYL